jgi:hypothetical protein
MTLGREFGQVVVQKMLSPVDEANRPSPLGPLFSEDAMNSTYSGGSADDITTEARRVTSGAHPR